MELYQILDYLYIWKLLDEEQLGRRFQNWNIIIESNQNNTMGKQYDHILNSSKKSTAQSD